MLHRIMERQQALIKHHVCRTLFVLDRLKGFRPESGMLSLNAEPADDRSHDHEHYEKMPGVNQGKDQLLALKHVID